MRTESQTDIIQQEAFSKKGGSYHNPIPINITVQQEDAHSVDQRSPTEETIPKVRETRSPDIIPKRRRNGRPQSRSNDHRNRSQRSAVARPTESSSGSDWEKFMDTVAFPEKSIPKFIKATTGEWTGYEVQEALLITIHETLLCGKPITAHKWKNSHPHTVTLRLQRRYLSSQVHRGFRLCERKKRACMNVINVKRR